MNIWIPCGSWWPLGENGEEFCVLKVYDVLGCIICSWHLIWKWSVENVIWFSFVRGPLENGSLDSMTSWFPSNSEVFIVVWFWDKCKVYFPAQQLIFCKASELAKCFPTHAILSSRRKRGNSSLKSRLRCIWYFFLCVVYIQNRK